MHIRCNLSLMQIVGVHFQRPALLEKYVIEPKDGNIRFNKIKNFIKDNMQLKNEIKKRSFSLPWMYIEKNLRI